MVVCCGTGRAGDCCDLSETDAAGKVQIGDTVFLGEHVGSTAAAVTVTDVRRVTRTGQYNVHTLSGNIVVNGVVSSHFTSAAASKWSSTRLGGLGAARAGSSAALAHWWYRMVDLARTLTGTEAEDESLTPTSQVRVRSPPPQAEAVARRARLVVAGAAAASDSGESARHALL